jgi:hypothetical protein
MKVARDYFSWSQYYLWQTNKKEFYKRYGLNEKSRSNIYFNKGKEFGEYKETGFIPGYVRNPRMLEVVGDAVPVLEIMEHKIEVTIGDINLLSYIDSGMESYEEFFEYKTGKEPWTQNRVDLHEQLDFYALCYYIASGETTIPSCTLYWIETEEHELENGNKEIEYTGLVEKFERTFTKQDLVKMMAKIINTRREIDEWEYEELELDEAKVNRYIYLTKQIEEMTNEANLIKLEVQAIMEEQNVKYASSEKGSFSISERKSWSYSDKLTEKSKKYKDEITKEQKLEQKNGEASYSVSTSLRFTIK